MTLEELLALPFVSETYSPNILIGCYYNHIPELADFNLHTIAEEVEKSERLVIRTIGEHIVDYRRWAAVRILFIDTTPVMLIRNAGREGDDFYDRTVFSPEKYHEMINWLRSLLPLEEELPVTLPEDLFCFYRRKITPGKVTHD